MSSEVNSTDAIGKMLRLSYLLTGHSEFNVKSEEDLENLMGGDQLPCNDKSEFMDMIQALSTQYQNRDPIEDIKLVLKQNLSCEKPDNFFQRLFSGGSSKVRDLIQNSSMKIIELLGLWFTMNDNNYLSDEASMNTMYEYSKKIMTSTEGFQYDDANELPEQLRNAIVRASKWDGRLETIIETFSIGTANNAPVCLIYNESALDQVLNTENLPSQEYEQTDENGESTGGNGGNGESGTGVGGNQDYMFGVLGRKGDFMQLLGNYLQSGGPKQTSGMNQ